MFAPASRFKKILGFGGMSLDALTLRSLVSVDINETILATGAKFCCQRQWV